MYESVPSEETVLINHKLEGLRSAKGVNSISTYRGGDTETAMTSVTAPNRESSDAMMTSHAVSGTARGTDASRSRSLICALAAIVFCLALALAGTAHLTSALADEGVPAGNTAAEGANLGDSQISGGDDSHINNESSAPEGDPSGIPAGDETGSPEGDAPERTPAGAADGASAPSNDAASNTDGTVTGAASSSAADATSDPDAGVAPAAAGDEQTVVDASTLNGWESHLTPGAANTQNIGRIWTDKTVADEDVKLSGGANMTVEKGRSDFLVGLSALGSMSSIMTETTKPLDIVLVLDMSGSMSKSFDESNPYEEVDGQDVDPDSGLT